MLVDNLLLFFDLVYFSLEFELPIAEFVLVGPSEAYRSLVPNLFLLVIKN
jgi:hypothetical protein